MLESERRSLASASEPGTYLVQSAGAEEPLVVGAIVLPFYLVFREDSAFLLNVEKVAAFTVDEAFARRASAYVGTGSVIPARDFGILKSCGLIATPAADFKTFHVGESRPYEGGVHTLVLNVIQTCNLRCGYCFAGDGSYGNSGKMSPETMRTSVDWYASQHTLRSMEVNFFGGEPLANFSLIRSAVEYVRSVARAEGKDIRFSITTNATLVTPESARFLTDNDFRIAVSIDGPSEFHDRNRPTAAGHGSLERVLRGLRLLQAAGSAPIARCTVHGETDIEAVQHFLSSNGFKQVHVAKATLPDGQDDPGAVAAVMSNARFEAEAAIRARQEGQALVNTVSKLTRLIVNHHKQTRACGVGDKIAAVGIDGGIYACHRFTNDEKWKIGHIEEGTHVTRFKDRAVGDIPKCRTCWAKNLCGGGCRHDNYSATGDPFSPPEEYCQEMKAYAEEAIIVACRLGDATLPQ